MKRILIFFTIIIAHPSVFSQLSDRQDKEASNDKIKFGIKAGVAIANAKVEYNSTTTPGNGKPTSKLGAIAGVFARLAFGNKACFQPELLMVGKGMKENNQSYSYRNDLTYLELPLNILYKTSGSKGSFFIGGGPAPAFYIGENVFSSGYQSVKKFDVGINFLAGYELPIGFSINMHYTHGLTNISSDKTFIPVIKNRCLGLTIGYVF